MGCLKDAVAAHGFLLADGAWGTNLMTAGLDPKKESADSWNLTHPEVIRDLARAYAATGAQIISTNTFGGNAFRLANRDQAHQVHAVNEAGVALAREGAGTGPLIAGAMGPTGVKNIGEQAAAIGQAFSEQARTLEGAGADFLLLETMTSPEEACIALEHISRSTALEVVCSFALRRMESGAFTTWSGASPATAIAQARGAGATMTGLNCYPADDSLESLLHLLHTSHPESIWWLKPNAGSLPTDGRIARYNHPITHVSPAVSQLYALGVRAMGGCCGTTPAHIAEFHPMLSRFRETIPSNR